MGEDDWITPERRENIRDALALLSLQFSGGGGEDIANYVDVVARENPTRPFEDILLRLFVGTLDLAQFLVLMRYDELAIPAVDTLTELGRIFAEPAEE